MMNQRKCTFQAVDALEMLVSCTGLTLASPAFPFLKSPRPSVIIPSLGMNSELYMMLQAGQSPDHGTHLDYQDATICELTLGVIMSESQHMSHPCRKHCVETGFTFRSVKMYVQGLVDFGYNDTLCVLKRLV